MKISLPQELKAILVGTVLGGVSSVLLSLTLEPEISEIRMGQYGAFIGLISASSSLVLSRNISGQKRELGRNKPSSEIDFNPILGEVVRNAAENHLNALQPGSPEYFQTLELYARILSPEIDPPPTSLQKSKTSHRNLGGIST